MIRIRAGWCMRLQIAQPYFKEDTEAWVEWLHLSYALDTQNGLLEDIANGELSNFYVFKNKTTLIGCLMHAASKSVWNFCFNDQYCPTQISSIPGLLLAGFVERWINQSSLVLADYAFLMDNQTHIARKIGMELPEGLSFLCTPCFRTTRTQKLHILINFISYLPFLPCWLYS